MSSNADIYPLDNPKSKTSDILSDYSIKGVIGKGTFSVVKLGENISTKEKVAIKILQKNKIINREDFIRINREIEMLKRLNHPNVIKIFKILEDSKKFCIIMEYCQNGELFNRIVEKQRLNEDDAALFYYQIICGLEYIHKNNIAHRDLKPENLLLSKDDILKIIDFGLSNYSSFNTLLETPCGSPCYASPEMVSGKKYNGCLIDIWSTGIILFAMICGYLPFEDDDNEILFGKILNCQIKYPKYIGDLPLDLMKKIIVPEPNKRITLNKIKEHPFYLKGKELFNQKHPEFKNNKIKEIKIKNITPIIIKHKSMKNKETKDNNSNNRTKIIEKKININIDNINNTYQSATKENYNYTQILNPINYNNQNSIARSFDFSISKENRLFKGNIAENRDKNVQKSIKIEKLENLSSNLNSEEIPLDSVPKEFNEENNDKEKNNKLNNNKEEYNNKIKNEIKSIKILNSQNLEYSKISNRLKSIRNNKDNEDILKSKKSTISSGEDFALNHNKLNNNIIKKPHNNIKKPVKIILNKENNNKLKERIVIEYCRNNDLNHTLENSRTTTNSNLDFIYNTENKNYNNKSKYSEITHKMPKTSYNNNKTTSIYEEKNLILMNEIKENYLSNSASKNSEKINYYGETKYPHNNHNKVSNTFIKEIKNISKYKNPNLNIQIENKNNNDIENNINILNINGNNIINNRFNTYTNEKNSNTLKIKNNNKQKIFDIFNELQLMQKNKKKFLDTNKKNFYINNLINIYENQSLSVGKSLDNDYTKNTNIGQITKKDSFDINKYINHINQINKNQNNINIYSDKTLTLGNSNQRKINESEINNNLEANMISIERSENLNNRYFDSITINNNNSINLHEPKLYIYVENNNNNNKEKIKNAKTFNKEDNPKLLLKIDKKNITSINKKNALNNNNKRADIAEHTKKLLISKRPYIENEINDKIFSSNKYNNIYNSTDGSKNNKAVNNDNYKNLYDILRKKNTVSKKIYNLIDTTNINNKNNDYLLNSDEIFSTFNKGNINYLTNRNQNIINNYYNNININNGFNNSSKNNKIIIDNDDYLNQNFHNISKTDANLDNWTYNINMLNGKVLKNKFDIKDNNNKRTIIGKNNNNINNYINSAKPISTIENLEHKIKLQKLQKRNNLSNNISNNKNYIKKWNENYKYVIPKSHYTENFENYNKLNISNNSYSPFLNTNYPNQKNYKKFIKQYNVKY